MMTQHEQDSSGIEPLFTAWIASIMIVLLFVVGLLWDLL